MDNKTLTQLKELDEHLQKTKHLDETDRQFVEQLRKDIEILLKRSGETHPADHESLVGQLQDATTRFEVSHPELTAVLGRVIDSLSNMGI